MTSTPTYRRTTATLCTVVLLFSPLACSSDSTDKGEPSTTVARATTVDAKPGTNGSKTSTPADVATFGYWIEGDSGSVEWSADLVSSNGGGAQQPIAGTWNLDGKPRWQLFTTWIDSGKVTFTLEGDGAATVSLIRGTASNPDDPTAGIDITDTVEKEELASGESVTFAFP